VAEAGYGPSDDDRIKRRTAPPLVVRKRAALERLSLRPEFGGLFAQQLAHGIIEELVCHLQQPQGSLAQFRHGQQVRRIDSPTCA
jgi:hypothetical protein